VAKPHGTNSTSTMSRIPGAVTISFKYVVEYFLQAGHLLCEFLRVNKKKKKS
jgi:hypothetical protein